MSDDRTAPTDDAALAADFASRKPEGLARAYGRYAGLLVSSARHVLGDAGGAEDCVHDALLRVWQKADSYRPERGSLGAFLLSCVRNEALSRLRKSGRRIERERRAWRLEPPGADSIAPADPFDAIRVRAALARLPAEQRETLESAYFDNLSHSEIALRLGVPLGTVKGRVALAMRKLRAELGPGAP